VSAQQVVSEVVFPVVGVVPALASIWWASRFPVATLAAELVTLLWMAYFTFMNDLGLAMVCVAQTFVAQVAFTLAIYRDPGAVE